MNFYNLSVEEVLNNLKSQKQGLSSIEASNRLAIYGKNTIEHTKKRNLASLFFKQFTDIMILILLAAGVISVIFAIIEKSMNEVVDAAIIFAIVLINGLLGFFQELKADKSINSLKKMMVSESKVIRDGALIKVKSEELTIGDVILLEAGDIVPADVRMIETMHFRTQEASLTGESNSVEKHINSLPNETHLADRKNMAYFGTNVTYGRGYGVVVGVGFNTEMGKIADMLKTSEKQETPIQKNLKTLGIVITWAVLSICAVIFLLEVFKSNMAVLPAFLTSVAIAVAAIPESLPAVVTIIMALGVNKLAKKKAIVKKLAAVETLGCCEVICSDKTGTLTENKMTVTSIYDMENILELRDESFARQLNNYLLNKNANFDYMIDIMALCNTCSVKNNAILGDPTEVALVEFANRCKVNKRQLNKDYALIDEIPFDSTRKLMTTIHLHNSKRVALTKGGLDEVLECCSYVQIKDKVEPLNNKLKRQIIEVGQRFASSALRVLAYAYNAQGKAERDMIFVGISGMIDPPRKEVYSAVESCKKSGMMPIMITGDYKNTAFEIAKRLGIANDASQVLTGAELDKLSDAEYLKIIDKIKVYARVTPENKVRIVKAFKNIKKIVAMTGDGVNDAPSIKAADIGIGMGISGTDISKEAADIIISDDNFATIIVAVQEGRKIFKNIEKTIKFLLSANCAETLSILLATIFYPQYVFLMPVQILFVNLITDSLPAIALGLEPAEKDIMTQKPRDASKSILQINDNAWQVVVFAIFQTMIILTAYALGLKLYGVEVAQAMAFYTLNIVQMFYIFEARIDGSIFKNKLFNNKWIWITMAFAFGLLALIAFTPLHTVLHLASLGFSGLAISLGLSSLMIPLCEIYKLIARWPNKR
ncbi:MAG: cation-translocating P-type ATPase [Firmicutes bacterium]|nr:cation-translocating P-type ATPase [Bacillota bacterium]